MAKQKGGAKQGRNKKVCEMYRNLGREERNAKLRRARHQRRVAKKKLHMESRAERACLPDTHPDWCPRGWREIKRWGKKNLNVVL